MEHTARILFHLLVLRPFVRLFIGVRVWYQHRLPEDDPFILVANHSSHMDTVSLLSLFPLERLASIRPVAAADYFEQNWFRSWCSRTFFNILPIPRKDISRENHPIDMMVEAIDDDTSLILFPEGTRGSPDKMGEFRPGIAHLVQKRPDVPVVPVYLTNMGRVLPKGEVLPIPFFSDIVIGEPCCPDGDRDEICTQLRSDVLDLKRNAEERLFIDD